MFIKILLNYLYGYVDIIVEGFFVERFINICTSSGIFLWKIRRDKSTIIYARVGINDFKEAVKIAKKTKCKMKIKNKKGLPFVFNKYKKRKMFVVLLVFLISSIIGLSNFIWNIEVTGCEKINKDEIIEIANKEGLIIGKWKNKIEVREIINKIRLERSDIAWVGIDIRGTNATIKVIEADLKPDIINEDEYCNIVSNKEASIIKVNAINGTPMVREGEVVKSGMVLIAGWLEGKYTGTRYVHSEGTIEAKVWYSHKERIYFNQEIYEITGNMEKKYEICINKIKINLFKKLPKFQKYDTIVEDKKLKLFSNLYLPVELVKSTYKEVQSKKINYTQTEAKDIGIKKCKEELEKEINSKEDLLNEYINIDEKDNYIDVEVIYEVKENIGTKEKIIF